MVGENAGVSKAIAYIHIMHTTWPIRALDRGGKKDEGEESRGIIIESNAARAVRPPQRKRYKCIMQCRLVARSRNASELRLYVSP